MVDFYNYIYKYFKLAIITSLLSFVYIIAYIDWVVHANEIHISEDYIIEHQIKYTKAMYGISKENFEKKKEVALKANNNKYNTIKYDFSLIIDSIWIKEKLFSFPMTYNLSEYEKIIEKKSNHNMIDFELMEVSNIKEWFVIWWHSSWSWYEKSKLKDVFNQLDLLEKWDIIKLIRNDGVIISYKVKNKDVKKLSEKLELENKYYIYTCYPIWTTEKRLIIELEEL